MAPVEGGLKSSRTEKGRENSRTGVWLKIFRTKELYFLGGIFVGGVRPPLYVMSKHFLLVNFYTSEGSFLVENFNFLTASCGDRKVRNVQNDPKCKEIITSNNLPTKHSIIMIFGTEVKIQLL